MNEKKETKKLILINLLIVSLVVFNLPFLTILAEEASSTESQLIENQTENQEATTSQEVKSESSIETGNVTTDVSLENQVNSNIGGSCLDGICSIEGNSSTSEEVISIGQESTTSNELGLGSNSGSNSLDQSNGNTVIETGNANTGVNLINVLNSNIRGSDFLHFLLNSFDNLKGDIDLDSTRNQNQITSARENAAQALIRFIETSQNKGTAINNLDIFTSSGANTTNGNNGDAQINTGNANVGANIFNLVNSNIVGTKFFFAAINSFANWKGDLILPGKGITTENSQTTAAQTIENEESSVIPINNTVVSSENDAYSQTNVNILAETGANTANNNGDTSIETGQANVVNNLINIANSNIVGQDWLFVVIRVFGKWDSRILSKPEGIVSGSAPQTILFFGFSPNNSSSENNEEELMNQALAEEINSVILDNENEGAVVNNVNIYALTGENSASGNGGSVTINTGDANVATNIANVVNTNILSRNWLLALVNIFGDWKGDIAFGRPDLWIGESVTTSPNPAREGGTITYTLTYANNGDADATQVTISDDFDERYLSVIDAGNGTVHKNPGEISWDIGTVPVGGIGSVSYTVEIDPKIPYGSNYLTNQSQVESYETDWDNTNNQDSLSLEVFRPIIPQPDYSLFDLSHSSPKLEIKKTNHGKTTVKPGENIDFTLNLRNYSTLSAYDVIVYDVLVNQSSEIINTYSWNLGEVLPKEEINIDYTIKIGDEVSSGTYTNLAQAFGFDGQGIEVNSNKASTTIEIITEFSTSTDVDSQLKDMQEKLIKVKEEIKRIMTTEPEAEGSNQNPVEAIAEILIPEASAQEENRFSLLPLPWLKLIEEGELNESIEKLLAGAGIILANSKRINIVNIFSVLPLLIIFLLSLNKKEEEKDEKENQ